jgi:PAT family beta-lactamase induction signal transducer AmpG
MFIAVTAAAMLKTMGVSNTKIAFWTSLIGLTWSIKPLWGSFIEMYKTKRFFVLSCHFITGLAFLLTSYFLTLSNFFLGTIISLGIIALCGAVCDTAGDGLYISVLSESDKAKFVGWNGGFWQVGKILAVGVAPVLAGMIEMKFKWAPKGAWAATNAILGFFFIFLACYNFFVLPVDKKTVEKDSFLSSFWDILISFFQKKYIWWGIFFLIFYRFCEGQAMKIFPLFLLEKVENGGLGLSNAVYGSIYGFFPPAALFVGSVVSGYFVSKKGLKSSLMTLCTIFNIPFAIYTLIVLMKISNVFLLTTLISIEYFAYGIGTIALTLFMMNEIASDGKYKTAHYAFASSIMTLGMTIPSMLSGWVCDLMGYKGFFIYVLFATIPSFLITKLVPIKEEKAA